MNSTNLELITSKLKALNQEWKEVNGWLMTNCLNPKHQDSKLSHYGVNIVSLKSNCFSCGWRGSPALFTGNIDNEETIRQMKYQAILNARQTIIEEEVQKKVILPPHYKSFTTSWRGLSAEFLNEAGIYLCHRGRFKGRIIFPIYVNNVLVGIDARAGKAGMSPKYLRSSGFSSKNILYPYDILAKMNCETIVLTEGIMDCLSFVSRGIASFCNFGVGDFSNKKLSMLHQLGVSNIVDGLDSDEAGRNAWETLKEHYEEHFNIVTHPEVEMLKESKYKDYNDYLKEKEKHA